MSTALYQVQRCNANGEVTKVADIDYAERALELAASWHAYMIDRASSLEWRRAEWIVVCKRNSMGDLDGIASFHHH